MNPLQPDRFALDGELVRRAQSGDAEAVAEIYRTHVQAIHRYILYRVGEPAVAEDLTSEVFLKAIQALDRYRHLGAPIAAWLFRIARDRVSDYHRQQSRRGTDDLDDSILDKAPGPEAEALQQSEMLHVRAQILRLTSEQQDVIYFRFTEGLTVAETASMMGKSIGAVKALQFRALRTLARNLG